MNVLCSKCLRQHLHQEPDHQVEVGAVNPDEDQVAAVLYLSLPSHPPHQVRQRPPPAKPFRRV